MQRERPTLSSTHGTNNLNLIESRYKDEGQLNFRLLYRESSTIRFSLIHWTMVNGHVICEYEYTTIHNFNTFTISIRWQTEQLINKIGAHFFLHAISQFSFTYTRMLIFKITNTFPISRKKITLILPYILHYKCSSYRCEWYSSISYI